MVKNLLAKVGNTNTSHDGLKEVELVGSINCRSIGPKSVGTSLVGVPLNVSVQAGVHTDLPPI